MARKRGRPPIPKNEKRGEVFAVRLRQDEAKTVADGIKKSGKARGEWMRDALLKHARE
jgi:hypothetical protein